MTSLTTQYNKTFPEDPYEQLYNAIFAVFDSWESSRAIKYRQVEGITGLLGTAVNVQAMCFGNMGGSSGTGVCFTRDPTTGERKLYGEYLINAQGEDGEFIITRSALCCFITILLRSLRLNL